MLYTGLVEYMEGGWNYVSSGSNHVTTTMHKEQIVMEVCDEL